MSFNPLDRVLNILENQPTWNEYRQYCRLVEVWKEVVEEKIAHQTRPLYLNRKVLWVATASAAWAQTLSLQRVSLLQELQHRLEVPLEDIRFSSARWVDRRPFARTMNADRPHPSQIVDPDFVPRTDLSPPADSLSAAFEQWSQGIQLRSRFLLPCPCCQAPTPPGEIERWSKCAYCIRQQTSRFTQGEEPREQPSSEVS